MNEEPSKLADRLDTLGESIRRRAASAAERRPPQRDDEVAEYRRQALARKRAELWTDLAPARFVDATLALAPTDVAPLLERWTAHPGTNLVLTGPVGVGKTWCALAAVRPLVEAGRRVAFWPVAELLDDLRPSAPDNDSWTRSLEADVIVLDDLGAERMTDWTAERLGAIVNRRWLDRVPVVATTNLAPAALCEALGERCYSRLVGGATVIRIAGEDQRRRPTVTTQGAPTP